MHYHIITGPGTGYSTANVVYDSLEESVELFVRLSKEFFTDVGEASELSINDVYAKMKDNTGAFVGVQGLAVYLIKCEHSDCDSLNWN